MGTVQAVLNGWPSFVTQAALLCEWVERMLEASYAAACPCHRCQSYAAYRLLCARFVFITLAREILVGS